MPESRKYQKYAIVGMEASVGRWSTLDQLTAALFQCLQAFDFDAQEDRWKPQPTQLEIDVQELGIPPDEFERVSSLRLAAMRAVLHALQDSGLDPDGPLPHCGLIAAASPEDTDLARWLAPRVGLDGPCLTLGGDEDWISQGLTAGEQWISAGEVEIVLFAGVFAPSASSSGSSAVLQNQPSLGFEQDMHGKIERSGAAALVIKPFEAAEEAGDRSYAVIESRVEHLDPNAGAAVDSAYRAAGYTLEDVDLIISTADGSSPLAENEQAFLADAFQGELEAESCAVVGSSGNFGSLGPVSPLLNLVEASLLLYHRFIPGIPGWKAPKDIPGWENRPFYFPHDSRPWFIHPGKTERLAGVNLRNDAGHFTHLILAGSEDGRVRGNSLLANAGTRLFPFAGGQPEDLFSKLDRTQGRLAAGQEIGPIARTAYQDFCNEPRRNLTLALIASTGEDLAREIDFARKGLPKAIERNLEWQTPSGSYFTPSPVGMQGGVAFVYPGAFNSFPGLGKDLFQLFPEIYPDFAELTNDMGGVLRERSLYPRRITAPSQKDLEELETSLSRDPIAMLTSGSSLAVVFTAVLRKIFAVHPQAAFGYSLGETSMLFSLRVWMNGDEGHAGLTNSPVFQTRLSGRQDAIREAWGLDQPGAPSADEPLWINLLVMASPETVQQAIAGEEHVYLTHINTPRQVVIAGYPPAVRRVAARIKAPSLQAPFDHALHCDPVRVEFDRLAALHDLPVTVNRETTLYTAAGYAPIRQEQKVIATDIAETLCSCLDFPRLVNRVYADGARVFIEVGAGSNCSRWVDETLKGSPHLAVSVSRKGSDDLSAILRTLARLLCHQVEIDLSPLYPNSGGNSSPAALLRKIQLDQAA